MHDVNFCLDGSIGQAVTDAESLNLWTNSSMNKTQEWLQGGLNQDDKNNPNSLYNEIKDQSKDSAGQMATWIQKNCDGNNLNQWSSALALVLQQEITELSSNSGSSSDWNADVGAVGPFTNMISSSMTQDTSTADSESKNMQSQLQTDNSALQPVADFGSTWSQNLSSLANALAQMNPS